MKQEQMKVNERRNSEKTFIIQNNFVCRDHIPMAPIQNSKSEYLRFMNFQRYYVFDSSQQELCDIRPLKITEWEKLINLISFLHEQYRIKNLTLIDVKGIWPIIGFFFPNRTGLFVNQFYSMMISYKLDLNMYESSQQKRLIQKMMNENKQQDWFKDTQFHQSLRTLIKQAKNFDNEEQNKILNQFMRVRRVFELNQQYNPFIETLNRSILNFDFFEPKKKQSVLNTIQDWKEIVCNSIFEPNQQQYVLSEPDTLVADICQTFEQEEYHHIRRKLSGKLQFDDETQTHVYQSTAKKTPKKLHKNLQQKDQLNQLSKFKRRLNFLAEKSIFSSYEQSQQKTVPIRRQRNSKPPRPKNHLNKMIQNQRLINKKNQKRVKKNQKLKVGKRMKKRQNFFLQKQIKKIYFDDSIALRKQKRNVQSSRLTEERIINKIKPNKRNQRLKEYEDWNQKYIEDQSVIEINSNRMEIEEQDQQYILSKNVLNKRSREKGQQKQQKYLDYGVSKQVKRRVSGARRQPKQPTFIVADDYEDFQDSKTKQKMPRKRQNQPKSHQIQESRRPSKQKNKKNRPSFQKKGKQFTRLRKQAEIEKQSQIQQNESFYVNHDEMIDQSQTINFERKQNLDKINKKNQIVKGNKFNEKYLHLFCENKKIVEKKNTQNKKLNTLENYLISKPQQFQQKFEPLQRIQIRKLSIFEFQQSERATQRMMMIQNEQLNPHQRTRKQVCHYQFINQIKMSFSLLDYMNYLESLQTENEIFNEIKELANEYLSKSYEPDFTQDKSFKYQQLLHGNKDFKLVLISRKILGLYILIKKEKQSSQNQNNQHRKFLSFEQTYIKPLLNHYLYKIIINMFSQIINSLFTSQGDEDFSLLNKASLPFMMLLYDLRQLITQQSFSQKEDFCKSLFEDMYQIMNQQATLILLEIMLDLNKNGSSVKNELKQKINKIMNNQNTFSYINLPRQTIKLMKKGLKVNLNQQNILYSSLIANTLFEIGFYQKTILIFTTLGTQNLDSTKLKQFRQINYDKGNFIMTLQLISKTILSLNYNDKGVTQVRNLSYVLNSTLQKIDFEFDYHSHFYLQCKVITCLLKAFKECSQNTSQVAINSNLNRKKIQQNSMKQDTLKLIKSILNRCLNNYIEIEIQKSVQFGTLMNRILLQKLKELQLNFSGSVKGQPYIQADLYLEIITVLMKFKQFKQNTNLVRPYVINPICKILKENRVITFAGKNKLADLVKKIFYLLINGYKSHIYAQGKIWQLNEQLLKQQTNISLSRKSIIQQYWFFIKELFQLIYTKCKEFSSFMKLDANGLKSFTSEIQQQKYRIYTNLFNEMLSKISQNISDEKIFNVQWIDKKCNEENCLTYSLQHNIVNKTSLLAQYNFFIDVDFISIENQNILDFLLSPTKLLKNLCKLTLVPQQIHIRLNYEDEDEIQEKLLLVAMNKEEKKQNILLKLLQVLSLKLNFDKLQVSNFTYAYINNNVKKISVISLIQLMKQILHVHKAIENYQNQKQKQNITSVQNVKPSFLLQFIKKFQYLSWNQHIMGNSAVHKELNEKQLQSLKICYQFILSTAKFITEINNLKQPKDKDLIGNQLIRRIHYECNSSKGFINFLTGVLLKNIISSDNLLPCFLNEQHKKNNKNIKIEMFYTMVTFWSKINEISHPSLLLMNQYNDINSFLYIVFQQMLKKKQVNKNVQICSQFLECCFTVYKQKIHNNPDKKLINFFNSTFSGIIEYLYCYMKQLVTLINKLNENKRQSVKNQILGVISRNYLKLFSTLLKWPLMLSTTIQKLKGDFQSIVSNELNLSNNNIKSLLDNLFLIKVQNQLDNDRNNIYNNQSQQINSQSIYLIEECIKSSQQLQANVYKIKQTVPNSLFLLVLKKIIEQQIIYTSSSINKKPTGLNHLIGNNNKQSQTKKPLKQIKLLKQIVNSLSQLKQSYLLNKLIRSFLRFLDFKTQKTLTFGQKEKNDPMFKYIQQEIKLHELGKRRVQDYRMKVFITIVQILKQSNNYRLLIQSLLWQNISHIESFLSMRIKQEQFNRSLNNKNKSINPSQQQTDNIQSYKHVQQIIYRCMIGKQSDFYLIKMVLNSRIQKLIDICLEDNIKIVQYKLNLLQKSTLKAIQISFEINNSLQFDSEIIKRCNRDLQQWFRQKLQYICFIKDILNSLQKQYSLTLKLQFKTLRDAYQSINQNPQTHNNKQQPTQIEFYITKMEIQQ